MKSLGHMLRLVIIILILLAVLQPISVYALNEAAAPSLYIDGLPVTFDVHPFIEKGRTLVPFRAIAEALNVQVNWDGLTQTITGIHQGTTLVLKIGQQVGFRQEAPVPLDVPPMIKEGRTFLPLRFFSESLGCGVKWNGDSNRIDITSPPFSLYTVGFYALGDNNTSSWTSLFGVPYPLVTAGNTDLIQEVALGWYSLDQQGNLLTKSRTGWQRPDGWGEVIAKARSYNLKPTMVIHMTDKDSLIQNLLSDSASIQRAVDSIATEAQAFSGVNLDFEGLGWQESGSILSATRQNFTSFTAKLYEKLKPLDRPLTLTLHPPNSAYQGYDYQALGKVSDFIIVMAYDYGTKPEPISLVRQAVEQSLLHIPANKLILGISTPSENSESIKTKLGIVKRYRLKGLSLWRLGLITPDMWSSLRNAQYPTKMSP